MVITVPAGYRRYVEATLGIVLADIKRNEDRRLHEYVGLRSMAWVPFDPLANGRVVVMVGAPVEEVEQAQEPKPPEPAPADADASPRPE